MSGPRPEGGVRYASDFNEMLGLLAREVIRAESPGVLVHARGAPQFTTTRPGQLISYERGDCLTWFRGQPVACGCGRYEVRGAWDGNDARAYWWPWSESWGDA